MSELVVENGKIFEKREISSEEVSAEIAHLTLLIAELQAKKSMLEVKQAEAAS